MYTLTSAQFLRKIADYQDGINTKSMQIQPDLAVKAGHMNLLALKGSYQPTPNAYAEVMELPNPLTTVRYLLKAGVPSSFIVGDRAAAKGQLESMQYLLARQKDHPDWSVFSFCALQHAIEGGHLEVIQLLCDRCRSTGVDFTHFYPNMFALAAASGHENIMDWLYVAAGKSIRSGGVGVSMSVPVPVPLEIQYESLVFHIGRCGINDPPSERQRHEQRVLQLLAANPTMLIQIQPERRSSARRRPTSKVATRAVDCCAAVGNLPLLQVIFAYHGCESHCALDHAARNGFLSVVRYLTGQDGEASSETSGRHRYTVHATAMALTDAAANNHLAVVDCLATQRYEGADRTLFDVVAGRGHLAMLVYIAGHLNDYFPNVVVTTDALDNAAANGHLDVVRYLSQDPDRHEGGTTDAMDLAAANGHLECLQWLYHHRAEGCTSAAFDGAAANGHKEVLEWLSGQLESGSNVNANARLCGSARALDMAAANGRVDILQWIHARFHLDTSTTDAVSAGALSPASVLGSPSALQQGQQQRRFRLKPSLAAPTRLAYDSAAGNGHLEALQLLLAHYENLLSVATIELAARGGHVRVLQWLYDNYTDMFMPQYAANDCGHGDSGVSSSAGMSVSRWQSPTKAGEGGGSSGGQGSKRLRTVRESLDVTSAPLAEALQMAIRHGECQAAQWLLRTLHLSPTQEDVDWAARNGHLSMLLMLMQHCNSQHRAARPSQKALEWAVLNGHIDVVQFLLRLQDNRLSVADGPPDFKRQHAAVYAARYGQYELELLLEHFIPYADRVASGVSANSPQVDTSELQGFSELSSVLVSSPSLVFQTNA